MRKAFKISAVSIGALILVTWLLGSTAEQSDRLRPGDEVVLQKDTWFAVNKEVANSVADQAEIGDTLGTANYALTGHIYKVPLGTNLLILRVDGLDDPLLEVRVLEGNSIGKSGWVRARWVALASPDLKVSPP